jgi:hypothetical protein
MAARARAALAATVARHEPLPARDPVPDAVDERRWLRLSRRLWCDHKWLRSHRRNDRGSRTSSVQGRRSGARSRSGAWGGSRTRRGSRRRSGFTRLTREDCRELMRPRAVMRSGELGSPLVHLASYPARFVVGQRFALRPVANEPLLATRTQRREESLRRLFDGGLAGRRNRCVLQRRANGIPLNLAKSFGTRPPHVAAVVANHRARSAIRGTRVSGCIRSPASAVHEGQRRTSIGANRS